jgi:hypothetical protein
MVKGNGIVALLAIGWTDGVALGYRVPQAQPHLRRSISTTVTMVHKSLDGESDGALPATAPGSAGDTRRHQPASMASSDDDDGMCAILSEDVVLAGDRPARVVLCTSEPAAPADADGCELQEGLLMDGKPVWACVDMDE